MAGKLTKIGGVVSVNMETGEETPSEGGMYMLPARPGACPECYVEHDPAFPHNQQSLSYQMRFHGLNGRWPTWTDAMAHCSPEMQAAWRTRLVEKMTAKGMPVPADLPPTTETRVRADK